MNSNTKVHPAPFDSQTSYFDKNLIPRKETQAQNQIQNLDLATRNENTNSELEKMIRLSEEQV